MPALKRVYFHPKKGYVFVKQGFSWPAFFFGALWALVRKMWLPTFAVMVILEIMLWFLSGYGEAQRIVWLELLGAVITLLYAFLRGKYGNRLLEASLLSRGFEDHGIVKNMK